jgi:hypothetical protein
MEAIHAPLEQEPVSVTPPQDLARSEVESRLVVLVPDVAEAAVLAGRIHEVAKMRDGKALLVGVVSQSSAEAELRRRLTLLAAFLQDAGASVRFCVVHGPDWIPALQALIGEGDLLACCVVQSVPGAGEAWIEKLTTQFRRPVYAFMDPGSLESPKAGISRRLAPWLGSILIILGFFGLQVWLSQQGDGAAYTGILLVTVFVEIGLIWLLNGLLG